MGKDTFNRIFLIKDKARYEKLRLQHGHWIDLYILIDKINYIEKFIYLSN